MNGKKAKMLRREAEGYTVGADSVHYEEVPSTKRQKMLIITVTIRLTAYCTRVVYKRLKRDYQAGLAS